MAYNEWMIKEISERIFTPQTAPARIIDRLVKHRMAELWRLYADSPIDSSGPVFAPQLGKIFKEFNREHQSQAVPLFSLADGGQWLEIKMPDQISGYRLVVPFNQENDLLGSFRPLVWQLLESGARINDWLFDTRPVLRFDYGRENDFNDNYFPRFEFPDIPDFLADAMDTVRRYLKNTWVRDDDRRNLPGMLLGEAAFDENWYQKTKEEVAELRSHYIDYRPLYWQVWLKNNSGKVLITDRQFYGEQTISQMIYGTRLNSDGINGAFTHIEQALLDEIELMGRVWDNPLLRGLPKGFHGCNILTALAINVEQRKIINNCLSQKI